MRTLLATKSTPLPVDVEDALRALEGAINAEAREARARVDAMTASSSPKALEAQGVFLRRAKVVDVRRTLLGRVRVAIGEDKQRAGHLDAFDAKSGASVHLVERNEDGKLSLVSHGVLVRRRRGEIEVVFNIERGRDGEGGAGDLEADDPIDLMVGFDEITIRRLHEGLARLRRAGPRAHTLAGHLMLGRGVRPTRLPDDLGASLNVDDALNDDQRLALVHALAADDVALVHGPPGTGKTRVLVEVVRAAVARGERVLALTASNAAVDHLARGLVQHPGPKIALTRLGDPSRVHDDLEEHTLSAQTEAHPYRIQARALVDEAQKLLKGARRRSDRGREAFRREREVRAEAGQRFGEARRLERIAVDDVISRARVVCATLTGRLDDLVDEDNRFDLLVVDEASQALTPALLLPLPLLAPTGRVVLAGDHKQLPPVVLADDASLLATTAFTRLMEAPDADGYGHMLTVQHRMNAELMAFPSAQFYGGRLTAHPDVATHTLDAKDSDDVGYHPSLPERVLDVVDTAGAGFDDDQPPNSASRRNRGEVRVIVMLVEDLVSAGVDVGTIGIIAPYSGQVGALESALATFVDDGLEIDSVDGFQGREKDVIVFSATRSNPDGEVGFLSDARRLNVAITRARKKLLLVGDSATLSVDPVWRALFDDAIARGAYRSVFEIDGAVG